MPEVVIVTGGAGAIGSAICRSLARDGINIVVAQNANNPG